MRNSMRYQKRSILVLALLVVTITAQQSFICNDGTSIPIENFCDQEIHCRDGSDELTTFNPTMPDFSARCNQSFPDRSCFLRPDYVCNQTIECHTEAPCEIGCSSHYPCSNTESYNSCPAKATICDGSSCNDCPDFDEWIEGIGFKCFRQGQNCKLPQELLWDGVQDCDDGNDLCFDFDRGLNDGRNLSTLGYELTFNPERCFRCLDGSMIVPRNAVCNGLFECSDLSDECLCENNIPDLCMDVKYSLPISNFISSSGLNSCEVGQIVCGDGSCVNRTSVCNSLLDCPDGRDERSEYCGVTLDCTAGTYQQVNWTCRCDVFCETNLYGTLCNGIRDCFPPTSNIRAFALDECHESCMIETGFTDTCDSPYISAVGNPLTLATCSDDYYFDYNDVFSNEEECNGVVDCQSNQQDEANCTNRFYCQAGNLINIASQQVCDGFIDCDDQSDEDPASCLNRFYCPSLGGQQVSISNSLVCDFQISCDDNSDEMNCSTTERFYCENGEPLFVPIRAVFDGRSDCSDQSDECPFSSETRREDNILSSRFELIGNPFLRALVWIMALLATFGNLAVIVYESRRLASKKRVVGGHDLKANHMFVLNLAVADLLMGIYLFILGIATAYYSGVYCVNSLQWLSSTACSAMGILVTLSSEASVLTLLFLTLYRLKTVLQPMKVDSGKKYAYVGIALSWFIASLIAFLPLSTYLQHVYVDRAFFPNNIFNDEAMVSFDTFKSYLVRLITFDPQFDSLTDAQLAMINEATSWKNLQDLPFLSSMDIGLDSALFFGFYSANSVCIPQLFVTTEDSSHLPSIVVNSFNFISFVIVATCYIGIYFKSRKSKLVRRNSKNKETGRLSKIEKKIIRLVITDFLCWVPISILAFASFSRHAISDIAYAVSAIVLLPINSALNPILYSDSIENTYAFFKTKCSKEPDNSKKSNESRSTDPSTSTATRRNYTKPVTQDTSQIVSESRL